MQHLLHTCDIARESTVGTNGRKQLQAIDTEVPALFLPMSAATAITNRFSLGKAFDVYMNTGTDVREGDRLTYNGKEYTVRGVMEYEVPIAGHIHIMAERVI